jgi:hypothetical protein
MTSRRLPSVARGLITRGSSPQARHQDCYLLLNLLNADIVAQLPAPQPSPGQAAGMDRDMSTLAHHRQARPASSRGAPHAGRRTFAAGTFAAGKEPGGCRMPAARGPAQFPALPSQRDSDSRGPDPDLQPMVSSSSQPLVAISALADDRPRPRDAQDHRDRPKPARRHPELPKTTLGAQNPLKATPGAPQPPETRPRPGRPAVAQPGIGRPARSLPN